MNITVPILGAMRLPDLRLDFPWAAALNRATSGNDIIIGTSASDHLEGMAGDDIILARGGNDTVFGDTPTGPTPPLSGAGLPPDALSPGNNLIFAGAGDDSITAGWGSDTVFGGDGDDLLIGYGGGYPSPAGFDIFLRGDGSDLLWGGAGNDTLLGGGQDDTLFGGAGDDRLAGGYGADILSGGPGTDHFIFAPQDPFGSSLDSPPGHGNRDFILDFDDDRIDLSAYQARFGAGFEPSFLGTDGFEAVPGLQIRYELRETTTLVQFVARGDTTSMPDAPTGEIELLGLHQLNLDHFLV
jgi:Ca2+-binding RTX toxin-like protein